MQGAHHCSGWREAQGRGGVFGVGGRAQSGGGGGPTVTVCGGRLVAGGEEGGAVPG